MAKKAAKKEAAPAKPKKTVKPAAKVAAKPTKVTKPAPKVEKPKATKPPKEAAKPTKESAKADKKAEKKAEPKKAMIATKEAPTKPEKKGKGTPAAVSEVADEAPKKEKKIKIDKTGLTEDQIRWHELHEKHRGIKAPNYSIGGQFEAKSPIQHKIFGWGFILSNEYDRLEVLFQDGKRMLISNRKL